MAKKRKGKLLYKLLIIFVGLAIIPLLAVRIRVLQVGQLSMKKECLKIQLEIARRSADTVDSFLKDIKNILFVIQKPKEFVAMDITKQRVILENLMKSYPTFMKLTVIDDSGMTKLRIPRFGKIEIDPGIDHSKSKLFTEAIEKGEYVSQPYRSPENYPFILISVPIEVYVGKPVGVLAAEINLIALSNLIAQIKIGERGISFVVDKKGSPIAHPDQKVVLKVKNLNNIPLVSRALEREKEGGCEFVYQDEEFLGSYVPVKKLGWRVIVQQPLSEAYLPATKMKEQVNIFLIGALIITILIGVFFSYRLVKPIRILQEKTEKVASGDFDTNIDIQSRDEIGELGEKFAFMSGALKKMTGELKEANKELDKWNKELEDRVEVRTRELRETQGKLVESERLAAVGQMANVVGHEIRNPLAAMKSSVYVLRDVSPHDDPDINDCLGLFDREIEAIEKICADMLGFSRRRKPVRKFIDLNVLIEESFNILTCPVSVKVFKKYAQNLPEVNIDRDEIRQVLANLIKNSFEIMEEKTNGGELRIETREVNGIIQIVIADTGPGISQENMEKMFTPFFSTKARGTGLGLAACQQIIERHDGKIWAESEGVGKGATFFVQLQRDTEE